VKLPSDDIQKGVYHVMRMFLEGGVGMALLLVSGNDPPFGGWKPRIWHIVCVRELECKAKNS
jgi:hypothetical protein